MEQNKDSLPYRSEAHRLRGAFDDLLAGQRSVEVCPNLVMGIGSDEEQAVQNPFALSSPSTALQPNGRPITRITCMTPNDDQYRVTDIYPPIFGVDKRVEFVETYRFIDESMYVREPDEDTPGEIAWRYVEEFGEEMQTLLNRFNGAAEPPKESRLMSVGRSLARIANKTVFWGFPPAPNSNSERK